MNQMGKLERIVCTETRPYNQGSRLTAFELMHDALPNATLICDSMASALMKTKTIDAVIVGADRIAVNGDTANKIGTYQLAICARYHGLLFIVAAPQTSIDFALANGSAIVVESRAADELTCVTGLPIGKSANEMSGTSLETVRVADDRIKVWNPAFGILLLICIYPSS